MLTTKKKQTIVKKHGDHDKDTGSSAVQVAILTHQIEELTLHLKKHRKDNHSRRGLLGMVARRRSHLKYLEKNTPKAYLKVTKELKLKK
ncbi:MAG: 30S ribosomal protein S15 [Patescibacteria group bacterium]